MLALLPTTFVTPIPLLCSTMDNTVVESEACRAKVSAQFIYFELSTHMLLQAIGLRMTGNVHVILKTT